jgi:hypothetical protein
VTRTSVSGSLVANDAFVKDSVTDDIDGLIEGPDVRVGGVLIGQDLSACVAERVNRRFDT